MKQKPILFSGEMVRAILDGRKTQTRRVVKPQPVMSQNGWVDWGWGSVGGQKSGRPRNCLWHAETWQREAGTAPLENYCPYGRPGDLLWVRETHYQWGHWVKNGFTLAGRQKWRFVCDDKEKIAYPDAPPENILKGYSYSVGWYKRNSIFMPRWASRITLRVTAVRVERVQDITDADATAEGIRILPAYKRDPSGEARDAFSKLWDFINAKRGYGWESNPWVWVVEFEVPAPYDWRENL
jgi:hypothetical protein